MSHVDMSHLDTTHLDLNAVHGGKEMTAQDIPFPLISPFRLVSREETLVARGLRHRLAPVPTDGLAEAVRVFWDRHAGTSLLVGALPFDRAAPCHLFAPDRHERSPTPVRQAPAAPYDARWTATEQPTAAVYADTVSRALERLSDAAGSPLRKVVLARSLLLQGAAPIDIDAIVANLALDPAITTYTVPLPVDSADGAPRTLVGATPELLVDKRGEAVESFPLAGSAPRSPDGATDRAAAESLLQSEKDHREHAAVVEAILDTLSPYCRTLHAPQQPELVSTASMWHLGSRITGTLRDPSVSAAELASVLHPTPAVCGLPRRAAREAIARLETFDRGFFAGAVGWTDRKGDGRWLVAIRCAEISDATARLYAGAGIVPGSDPQAEAHETGAKFSAMLNALGLSPAAIDMHLTRQQEDEP